MSKKIWSIYLLWNDVHRRTYIGATTDVKRRLRQHRQEIVGGAKSTARLGTSWNLVCWLVGFTNQSSAYRWEKLLKMRCTGLEERVQGFKQVAAGVCPVRTVKKRTQVKYSVPDKITLYFFPDSTDNINSSSDGAATGGPETSSSSTSSSEVRGVMAGVNTIITSLDFS